VEGKVGRCAEVDEEKKTELKRRINEVVRVYSYYYELIS